MWKMLARARQRFDRDQRGNVAILFAVTAVPLLALLGGAVDVTRHQRDKVVMLNAMDAAALALAKHGAQDSTEATAFVNQYIATMLLPGRDPMLHARDFKAVAIDGGWRIVSNASMDTAFLQLVGLRRMPLHLESEVQTNGGKYEVALALDNTTSMLEHDKIGALRIAANHLIDILYEKPGAEDRVKMALVPFTDTVNIRGAAFSPDWLDPTGQGLGTHRFDAYDRDVSRLDIYKSLGGGQLSADGLPTAWKGCVEARADGHDVDDTAPGSDPATRWTPFLSPDGSDIGGNPRYASANSYLSDRTGGDPLTRLRNTDKYFSPILLASHGADRGPGQYCQSPIVELTSDEGRIRQAIADMTVGGYTHIPLGLAWGWRTLSPGEPFDQGAPYDDVTTQKALVLLSDGKNTFPDIYTAYGYRADGRLATSEWAGVAALNDKVSQICAKVKAAHIRLYMILFEENDPQTQGIFQDCASVNDKGESLFYYAPDGASLKDAFGAIGKDLSSIRISR